MNHHSTPQGLLRAPQPCWTLAACPPGVDLDECGPGLVHLASPSDAAGFYLEQAETTAARDAAARDAADRDTEDARRRFRTHLYPWPVSERVACAVAALAVTTSGEPCWLVTCTRCGAELESDTGALHCVDIDRAVLEAETAGWTVRGGQFTCGPCAGRDSVAEVLDDEACDRLDPDRRLVDPAQLTLPGLLHGLLGVDDRGTP